MAERRSNPFLPVFRHDWTWACFDMESEPSLSWKVKSRLTWWVWEELHSWSWADQIKESNESWGETENQGNVMTIHSASTWLKATRSEDQLISRNPLWLHLLFSTYSLVDQKTWLRPETVMKNRNSDEEHTLCRPEVEIKTTDYGQTR